MTKEEFIKSNKGIWPLRLCGLLQLISLALIFLSPFIMIWNSSLLGAKVLVTGVGGVIIFYIIYAAIEKVMIDLANEIFDNNNLNKKI